MTLAVGRLSAAGSRRQLGSVFAVTPALGPDRVSLRT